MRKGTGVFTRPSGGRWPGGIDSHAFRFLIRVYQKIDGDFQPAQVFSDGGGLLGPRKLRVLDDEQIKIAVLGGA